MSTMGDKIHRVVLSLTDTTHKLSINNKNTPADGEVKLLDKTTMLLRSAAGGDGVKSFPRYYQQLQFDAVGYEDDKHIQIELGSLLEKMIKQGRNGTFIRLTPRRTHNIRLLTHLLISEMDKLLLKQPYHLIGINVDYYDVRKFDMVNMLSANRNKSLPSKRFMQTTREMFQWLHNEYAVLRGRGTGDDHINVEFMISDGVHKPNQVNLSIYQVFDCNERTDLSSFFKALPEGKRTKGTLLIDCVKESFDMKRPIATLVLCEMPLDKDGPRDMHKFLQLAHLAFTSSSAAQGVPDVPHMPLDSSTSLSGRSKRSSSSSHSLDSSKPRGQLPSTVIRSRASPLSHDDYGKLATWYHRIDAKYADVKISMERHYELQYRQKFLELCKQLNSFRIFSDKSGGDAHSVLLNESSKNLAATTNYVEALKQFRQLEREVKRSPFTATLSPYMNTKNYELANAEEALQEQETINLHKQRRRM